VLWFGYNARLSSWEGERGGYIFLYHYEYFLQGGQRNYDPSYLRVIRLVLRVITRNRLNYAVVTRNSA
jgi:hypothetical protein